MEKQIQQLLKDLSYAGQNNVTFHFHPEESKKNAKLLKELLRRYNGQKRTIDILMEINKPHMDTKLTVHGAGLA